jgi:tetratricopeptide (TPR) repeat protein
MVDLSKVNVIRTGSAVLLAFLFLSCGRNSSGYFMNSGNAKFKLKDYPGAITDFNKALGINDKIPDAYYVRGLCYGHLLNYEKALEDFNKVIELDKDYKDAYFNRAFFVKEKTGDFAGAIDDYNKFIGLNPDGNNAFAHNNRGYAWFKLGETEKAWADIELSISLDPSNSYVYKNRAKIFIEIDSLEAACFDLQKAASMDYAKNFDNEVNLLIKKYCTDQSGT